MNATARLTRMFMITLLPLPGAVFLLFGQNH